MDEEMETAIMTQVKFVSLWTKKI